MTTSNIPDEIDISVTDSRIKFSSGGVSTNWLLKNDAFTKRINESVLNPVFLKEHIIKEIEIKNILDEGIRYLNLQKYQKANEKFDEVLFYDPDYALCLLNKSYSLKGQGHFVKSLRYYKRALKADAGLKDVKYYKNLLKLANDERGDFSKLKLNIYAGDEFYSKGEFSKAVESYDKALVTPSKFRDKILFKLLNKKGSALLKLEEWERALKCFTHSAEVFENDCAYFGEGLCEYELHRDVADKFRTVLDINKKQMLRQVLILNELELFEDSLTVCDYLFKNHFKTDDFYFVLLNAKMYALKSLEMDSGQVENIIDRISEEA